MFNTTKFPCDLKVERQPYFDVSTMLELADYFGAQHIIDMLEKLLCNYVRDVHFKLAFNLIGLSERLHLTSLKQQCITRIKNSRTKTHMDKITNLSDCIKSLSEETLKTILTV